MEMECNYSADGCLVVQVDEDTIARVNQDKKLVTLRQDMGETERVFLTVAELRELVAIFDKEGI
jgi:hypothetical protein